MTGDVWFAWEESGTSRTAVWNSVSGLRPPRRAVVAADEMSADDAYRLAAEGTALLWRGDYHNAGQLLRAIALRIDRRARKGQASVVPSREMFHKHRLARAQRAQILGKLLIPFDADGRIPLRRAPDLRAAFQQAFAMTGAPSVAPLRDLQGLAGAYEWRQKGIHIACLDARIHPHFGVFAPVRNEYVDLVAQAPLPESGALCFDIGTGTGILAAVLARRGLDVIATDCEARAVACAEENIARLGLRDQVAIVQADFFPDGKADIVVCNPPWLPGVARTSLERAVFDPESRMLVGFLGGLRHHLNPGGEGWLILSDLAEHLRLRTRDELLNLISASGLRVVGRTDARPTHRRSGDGEDPLFAARSREVTSLWCLVAA